MKLLSLALLFLSSLSAFAGISVTVRQFQDVLPAGGVHRCLYATNSTYGFLFVRELDSSVSIYPITNGVVEGEEGRLIGDEIAYGNPFITYLKVTRRSGDFGLVSEFLLENQTITPDDKAAGRAMFTEVSYYQENGEEKESLSPLASRPLLCKREN